MEIRPPDRVNPIDSSRNKPFDGSKNGFPSKKLKEILSSLRESILGLSDWIKEIVFGDDHEINEKALLSFIEKTEAFYASINDLEEYASKFESQNDLHLALGTLAEIDNMLKGEVKRLTLCSYWKYDDFSLHIAMERSIITPLIDVKRASIHLFDEVPEKNWGLVISIFDKMAEKLLV